MSSYLEYEAVGVRCVQFSVVEKWWVGYRGLRQIHFLFWPLWLFLSRRSRMRDGRTLIQHQDKLVNAVVMYLVCYHFLFLLKLPNIPETSSCLPCVHTQVWSAAPISLLPVLSWLPGGLCPMGSAALATGHSPSVDDLPTPASFGHKCYFNCSLLWCKSHKIYGGRGTQGSCLHHLTEV